VEDITDAPGCPLPTQQRFAFTTDLCDGSTSRKVPFLARFPR
jgi:hypothetical protein